MDSITSQPQNLITPELPSPHKHFLNKKFAITFVILLLLAGGAYAGIWYWGNQQQSGIYTFEECVKAKDSKMLETYPEQCVTSDGQTFPNPDQTAQEPPVSGNVPANWKTYTNSQYGVTFRAPLGWQVNEPTEIFPEIAVIDSQKSYTSDATGRYNPAIYISKQADKYSGSITKFEATFDSAIRALRQQQTIIIDDKTVYVYSGITPPTAHDFRVIFAGGNVYTITSNNPLIGAEQSNTEGELAREDFNQILSTFKFTESNSGSGQTMCTQEAKQCPDGSYVSRTGPNCAFAVCP